MNDDLNILRSEVLWDYTDVSILTRSKAPPTILSHLPTMSIGVALLGAGVFARKGMENASLSSIPTTLTLCTTEHLPAIKACPSMSLRAVYSRSQASAEKLAAEAGEGVDTYFDSPSVSSKSLDALLSRADIAAVIIAVAIPVSPELIKKALRAGKHVLSEKPIAPEVKIARELIDHHRQQARGVLWAVGENFRFWEPVHKAASILKQMGGSLVTFSVTAFSFTDVENPFYHSDW
jgi:predicted dehydrogenase